MIDWSTITNMTGLVAAPNATTGGWFYFGITMMVFFIILISLMFEGMDVAIITAGLITFIVSALFSYAHLVDWKWTVAYFGVTILGLLFLFLSQKE